jgi:hypothetical protein
VPDPIPVALLAYAWADTLDDLGLAVLLPAAVLVVGGVSVAVEAVGRVLGAGRRRP